MWNSPTLNFEGCASAWNAPSSASSDDAQAEHRAVVLQRHLAVHVEVAREPGGDQVLGPVLDPLHGVAEQQRRGGRHDVARVHRHLVAEPAADVGRDDPDVLLGQARHQREDRADRVRRLRGHVDRGLAGGRVDVGDAAAGLERRGVRARVVGVERRPPCRPRRRPRRWRPCRRTPSGRCGCRSGPPSRRGSPGRRRPPPPAG